MSGVPARVIVKTMTRKRVEPTRRRIRARIGDRFVADSTNAKLVFVERRHPEYFFPNTDVALTEDPSITNADELGPYHPIGDIGLGPRRDRRLHHPAPNGR